MVTYLIPRSRCRCQLVSLVCPADCDAMRCDAKLHHSPYSDRAINMLAVLWGGRPGWVGYLEVQLCAAASRWLEVAEARSCARGCLGVRGGRCCELEVRLGLNWQQLELQAREVYEAPAPQGKAANGLTWQTPCRSLLAHPTLLDLSLIHI